MARFFRRLKRGSSDDRLLNPDGFIITTRVKKGFKRWKFLQTEITKKQRTVENGGRSKRLEPYKKERDALVQQMREDISELQSIFYGESAESHISQLKRQLENERKSKEETLSRLNMKLDESEKEIWEYKEKIRKLQERLSTSGMTPSLA